MLEQSVVDRFAAALPAAVGRFDSGTVQQVTPEQVVGGIGSRSYPATMDDAGRTEFLGRVRERLAIHPDTAGRQRLELPHRTRTYRLVLR